MKRKAYQAIATLLVGVACPFVLTGSYFYINKPAIPDELRKKTV